MLDELGRRSQPPNVTLAIAHDIGQVRDMLREGGTTQTLQIYPTVPAALDAARPIRTNPMSTCGSSAIAVRAHGR